MRVVYKGPHAEVEIAGLGPDGRCKRGQSIEVPDEVGASLVKQDCWESAAPTLAGKNTKPQSAPKEGKE